MTQSEARCREAFEKWHEEEHGFIPSFGGNHYDSDDSDMLYDAYKAAYFTHHAALKRCVEALEYYADRGNYFVGVDQMHPTVFKPTNVDEGYRARQTLAELKEMFK